MSDEFDFDAAAAASLTQSKAQDARIGFAAAIDANPDAYAEDLRIARRTGLPAPTVAALPREAKRQDAMGRIDFDTLARTAPATAALLADTERAKLAHDDVENMSALEGGLAFLKNSGKALASGIPGFNASLWGLAQAGTEAFIQPVTGLLAGTVLPEDIGARMAADFGQKRRFQEGLAKGLLPKADGIMSAGYYSGLQSLSQNLLTLPLAFGGPELALGAMSAQPGGQAYGEARDKGVSVPGALAFGTSQAAIEYATEKLPMHLLLKDLKAGTPFYKTLVHQMASEVPGEQIATVLQDANEWAVLHPEAPFAEYWNERPSAMAQTLIATLVGTGGQVSVIKGVQSVTNRFSAQEQQAQQAEPMAQGIEQLNRLAEASKLRQRDPETFSQFVADAAENGPVQHVFLDAQTLAQSGLAEQVAALSPAVAEQYQTALETGGQLRIPVAEYAATIAGSEFAQPLLDHLKTEPDGFSRAEAQEYMQSQADTMRAEVERVMAEKQDDDTFKASRDAVKADIKTQLDAANRFKPDVNDAYASMAGNFYAVTAAKMGLTPEALFVRYPLTVSAEDVTGPRFNQSGGQVLYQSATSEIQKALDLTKTDKTYTGSHEIMPVAPEAVREASTQGFDIQGYTHVIDGSAIRHTLKNHGNAKREAKRGQIAVTDADFAAIPSILAEPDTTIYGLKNDIGRDMIVYLKTMADGTTVYLEEIRTGRKKLATQSMRRYPRTTNATSILKSLRPTSETFPEHPAGISVVNAPEKRNPGVLEQLNRGAFNPATLSITLLKNADLSTFLHESGHFFLEVTADLAARPDSPIEIQKDMAALLEWFGVRDIAEWYALDFEEKRSYHEQFARGFEAYLFEGKAPNIELQSLFQRFRAWMLNVYKELKNLNVELTSEVRQVFDRMLATTEEIQLAEQGRSMLPLFETAEQAGMAPEDFAAYQALGTDATADAIQELQARGLRDMRWLHNAKGHEVKKLQKEAKARRTVVEMDVRREVMSQPVYRAWQFLTDKAIEGGEPVGKLNTKALNALPPELSAKLVARKMTALTGLHPDVVSDLFGFTSGDELMRKLAEAAPPADEIAALTDRRMLEQYGDLSSPEAIDRAADQAIHNDARARVVATEHNALAKATGRPRVLAAAAKQFAAAMVARLKVRDIRPGQYAAAEVRAAKAAQLASKKGDLANAATEKRNQLINLYANRAALDAQDEVRKILDYFKRFDTVGKSLDVDYREQIEALLERFDLRKGQSNKATDKRKSLAAWVDAERERGLEPDIPDALLNEATRKSVKDMTLEELRGLRDTVAQIEHLGRLKSKLLTAQDQREYAAVRDEIVGSIEQYAGDRVANTRTATTNAGRIVSGLKRFWAAHIKVAIWSRIMDGGHDGGPMWEYFIRSANAAADAETVARANATQELSDILAPVLALGKMGGKGQFFPAIQRSLNRESRLAIALNVGNEGNLQRLLGGEGWTGAQLKPVLDSLTAAEWHAVQAVWDHFEQYRPQIAAKERRVYGKEPNWVEPRAFTVMLGQEQIELRGGYYPIKYDPAASERAEAFAEAEDAKRQLQGAYTSATTRRSFTKARADEVSGRPLLYTLAGMYSGVNDVIHDLSWHEWLIDANRLLRSKSIDGAIRNHYGPEVKQQFKSWVQDVAEGERGAANAGEAMAARLRQHVSVAGLGFNLVSALMQPLGLSMSMSRIGTGWVGRGLSKYISSPLGAMREANEKSAFMEMRARTQFRELNELRNRVQGQSGISSVIQDGAYILMTRCQQMVDVPTWHGAYLKALAEGNADERAVALADQAVIDAQGGGMTKDLSAIERGNPAVKLFTVFYSFMNTTLNMGVAQTMTANSKAKLMADYLLIFVVPAVLGALLKSALTPGGGGDDDWSKLARSLIGEQLGFMMGLMVGTREAGDAAKTVAGVNDFAMGYRGPAGLRVLSDASTLATQLHQGELDDAFRKALINTMGSLFGFPAAQINRTMTGVKALAEGKTHNPLAIGFGFQEKR